jgi:HemY protein
VKRFFLYALLALGAGTALALFLQQDPGYLLLSFRGWQLETTLAALITAALLLGTALIALLWLLRLGNPLRWWRSGGWGWLRGRSAEQASADGLQSLLLGRWQEAYKLLVANAERVQNPVFNYALAAIAAQQQGDALGCAFCLDRAEKKAGEQRHGIRCLRALLEQQAGHPESAKTQLLALKHSAPPAPLLLRQLMTLQQQLGDWEGLAALLPELGKQQVLPPEALQALQLDVARQQLQAAARDGLPALRLAWQDLPKSLRQHDSLLLILLEMLLAHNHDTEACTLLGQFLKQQWSDALIHRLGCLRGGSAQQLLLLLEAQLKQRPNHGLLMLTLGRLSLRERLWNKARDYFEHALNATREPQLRAEIAAELARLLQHLGERDASLQHYEQAMGMLQHRLPELPLPLPPR